VKVQFSPDRLTLQVEDHGVGIGSASNGGSGLVAMRERAMLLKGTLSLLRPPEGGTRVTLDVPLRVE
jgi:signal transduction histidine kinase